MSIGQSGMSSGFGGNAFPSHPLVYEGDGDIPGGPSDTEHHVTRRGLQKVFDTVPELTSDFSDGQTPPELRDRVTLAKYAFQAAIADEKTPWDDLMAAGKVAHDAHLAVVAERFSRQTPLAD